MVLLKRAASRWQSKPDYRIPECNSLTLRLVAKNNFAGDKSARAGLADSYILKLLMRLPFYENLSGVAEHPAE